MSLVKIDTVVALDASGLTFQNVQPYDLSDTTNLLIELLDLDLVNSYDFVINDITVDDTPLKVFSLDTLSNSDTNGSTFTLSNLVYQNTVIEYQNDMIIFEGVESESDFTITISDVTMSNISFTRGGNIFLFSQQTESNLILKNSHFSYIDSGTILLNWYNQQSSILSKVTIQNITATQYNGNSNNFIYVDSGSILEMYSSTFTYMSNLDSGSVVYTSSSSAEAYIYSTVFKNNTSINGGVFSIQDESYLKCTNCTFDHNFAIQSGIAQVNNDGYFEFNSCTFTNNIAFSALISQIFLSSPISIIDNSHISSNYVLHKEDIMPEIEGT